MRTQTTWRTVLTVLAYSYVVGLFGWALLYNIVGDSWWWLFLINSLAIYLFLPLLLLPIIILVTRHHVLWLGFGVGSLLWLSFYGFFLPHTPPVRAEGRTLSVMTYNLLRHNLDTPEILDAIRAADADVVALQELNGTTAAAITNDLRGEYPYQLLEPGADTSGMGIISRYPLQSITDMNLTKGLPDGWVGPPQLVEVMFFKTRVTLLNVHAQSTNLGYGGNVRLNPANIEESVRIREEQMHALLEVVAQRPGPLLLVGDLNTGYPSRAYDIIAEVLHDAWHEAGQARGTPSLALRYRAVRARVCLAFRCRSG
ncbi:MAG: hypothetical protein HC914_07105 [Chloroflexaceae bacterium]|nr:hypothetical protein [Chloroflexaceae bacterium]